MYYLRQDMPSENMDYDEISYEDETYSETYCFPIKRKRLYYPTKLRSRIVNAKTGVAYPYCQGSYEELQLFKMIDSTAWCDENGYVLSRTDPVNKDPNFLYYDSPEQFMRHRRTTLDPDRIKTWHINHYKMFPPNRGFIKSEWDRIKAK